MSSLGQRLDVLERAVARAQEIDDYAEASRRLNELRVLLGELYVESCTASPPKDRCREAVDFRSRIDALDRIAYVAIGRILIETRERHLRRRSRSNAEAGLLTISRLGIPVKQRAARMVQAAEPLRKRRRKRRRR